jgi:thioredoxin reductase (NADPH)
MEKLIIIGSGPSGLTAAIYASRANLAPLVFGGNQPGGQITTTSLVENWPGAPEGVMGPKLVMDMMKQAEKFGARLNTEIITKVDFSNSPYKIFTDKDVYETESVIIATGARPRRLGLANEDKLLGHGVHTCATCDGAFYRGKIVIVIGGGDSAMEEANFLSKFAEKVILIHRAEIFNASVTMQERTKNNPKVEIILNSEVVEYLGAEKLTGVKIKNSVNQETSEVTADGLFFAIGHIPNTDLFVGQLTLAKNNYLVPTDNVLTEKPGIFVAGDVADQKYRQAITSSAFGCMAALEAEKYLSR